MSGTTIFAVIECLIKFGIIGAISYGLYETYGTILWSGVLLLISLTLSICYLKRLDDYANLQTHLKYLNMNAAGFFHKNLNLKEEKTTGTSIFPWVFASFSIFFIRIFGPFGFYWIFALTILLRYFYNLMAQLDENAQNLKNEMKIAEKEIRNMIEVAEEMMFDFGEDSYKCDFYDLDKFEKNWKIWEKKSENPTFWVHIKLSMAAFLVGLIVETTVDAVFKPLISLLTFPFFSFLLFSRLQTTKWKFEKFEEKCDMLWAYVVFAFDLAHRAEENLEDDME
ncbi:Protein CBG26574 [Caenorhabditis briggsae]|uniref:Protein CBG26574 n=1 Tax=Caenorhabditis briggsae TaxID=6238 RepID=B6IFQ3_CAEBR|nr:Protein CBG26574 [Caenorhabditis briggsae]CAR98733.1 Protein CBG26574 [Caenorhabditis briggsae]